MAFANAPGSYGLLAIIAVVSLLGFNNTRIIERNLLRPWRVANGGDWVPVITHAFIHGSFGHLLFNGLTLYFFGPTLEQTIGTPRFLTLYAIGLLASGLGTVWKHRRDPNYASLGASGAILAVLFAYIVYYPTRLLYLYFAIPVPASLFAFGYLAYTLWASKYSRGRINHDAHFDGALTGILFVAITDYHAWERAVHAVFR